jgi:hypothetical protein
VTTPIHAYATVYTDVDLNSTATTTIADPEGDAEVPSVHLNNGGGTAELRLEVTDGTDTAVLSDPGAGGSIHFTAGVRLGLDDSLQVVVETAEGAALTETAAVGVGEH